MPVAEALARVLEHASPLPAQQIGLQDAHGRVLAENLAARENRRALINGIARIRHENDFVGIHDGQRQVPDALLRTDQRIDFRIGVHGYVETLLHELRGGLAEVF